MKKFIFSIIGMLTLFIGTASAAETKPVSKSENTEECIQIENVSKESLKAAAENLSNICTKIKKTAEFDECKKEFEALNETIRKMQQAELHLK